MKVITAAFFFLSLTGIANAQQNDNAYAKLGQKALIDGDFKLAVIRLEKALPEDNNNVNLLAMLGYSYYHSGNYAKAISTYGRVISLHPADGSAYYYRGKARDNMATELNSPLIPLEKEKMLLASIRDFSKALEINSEDVKLYQNRAIAYRDYGILKSQKTSTIFDKSASASAYKSCMTDLQKVIDNSGNRPDIALEMKKCKVYLASLDN